MPSPATRSPPRSNGSSCGRGPELLAVTDTTEHAAIIAAIVAMLGTFGTFLKITWDKLGRVHDAVDSHDGTPLAKIVDDGFARLDARIDDVVKRVDVHRAELDELRRVDLDRIWRHLENLPPGARR